MQMIAVLNSKYLACSALHPSLAFPVTFAQKMSYICSGFEHGGNILTFS